VSQDIERALGRIEGKLDLLLPSVAAQEERLTVMVGRVSKLEKWQSKILGGAVVAGFLLGIVMRALHL
jgi:hypothetical protein